MMLRSLLFVPGDRPERFTKAAESGADAIILDLEDSVSLANKPAARQAVSAYLSEQHALPIYVRLNALDSGLIESDVRAILPSPPHAVVLPKSEGAASVRQLQEMLGGNPIPILPIATETPSAIFQLGSYKDVSSALAGLTWGAEDLPAAIGAATSRREDGTYTSPYEMVRALTLFGAHAAGVSAIDTVFPEFKNIDGLAEQARCSARDGFTGMLAIHPAQIATINAAFTPRQEDIAWARAVTAAFEAAPNAGVLQLNGQMIDRPHFQQAQKILIKANALKSGDVDGTDLP